MITKTLLLIMNLVILWLTPLFGALIFICFLVLTDTITGVYSAHKKFKRTKRQKDKVTSNKAFKIVPKLLFYGVLVLVGQGLAYYVEPSIPWVKIALAGVSWIEIKSIDENFTEIFGYSFIQRTIDVFEKVKQLKKREDE